MSSKTNLLMDLEMDFLVLKANDVLDLWSEREALEVELAHFRRQVTEAEEALDALDLNAAVSAVEAMEAVGGMDLARTL